MKWSPWASSWGRPLLTHTSTGDTQTQFWLSLCGVSGSLWGLWCTQGLFEPSDCLWCIRGLNLNAILPLLPSCWGFSFALGCGVSFWGESNTLLSMFVQQQVVVLESSQENMSSHPFTQPSWKAKTSDCVDHNNLWKILKELGIPDHLICLLRNLYAGQEATVRTGHGTTD